MVGSNYMVARPAPPGPFKRMLHQALLPASINLLYRGESLMETIAERIQRAPATALLAALGCGYVLRSVQRRR